MNIPNNIYLLVIVIRVYHRAKHVQGTYKCIIHKQSQNCQMSFYDNVFLRTYDRLMYHLHFFNQMEKEKKNNCRYPEINLVHKNEVHEFDKAIELPDNP